MCWFCYCCIIVALSSLQEVPFSGGMVLTAHNLSTQTASFEGNTFTSHCEAVKCWGCDLVRGYCQENGDFSHNCVSRASLSWRRTSFIVGVCKRKPFFCLTAQGHFEGPKNGAFPEIKFVLTKLLWLQQAAHQAVSVWLLQRKPVELARRDVAL